MTNPQKQVNLVDWIYLFENFIVLVLLHLTWCYIKNTFSLANNECLIKALRLSSNKWVS